ncbi:MAG: UvrD-helicase domain-containing protein [Myxococcales bacterium]
MSFASGLNEQQRAAVLHGDGPLVVFAGAGSGKTRVITHRVAHLVGELGVAPWRILAVTFTNKAAGEMRERLSALLPGGAEDLWVGTFHAICARLLRRYHEEVGIRRDFVIYDDADQKAMLTRIIRDMGFDERRYHPRMVAGAINRAKQEGLGVDRHEPGDDFERAIHEIFEVYEARMAESGALDFGDLIFRLVDGMRANPALLSELQDRFSHVLVDEYQDTNHVQYLMVQMLCERSRNLCVVGDDDQSIYRWRGADRRNILDFTRHFPDARLIKLEQNYRSTQRILRVANAVVRHNIDRQEKELWTENDEGAKVTLIACGDERDEASTLVKAMQMLLQAGYARSELALLYRTHAQARVFEEALRFHELPYRVVGGVRFYDRAEVKDLLAYLRVVHNPSDDVSLLRIINVPTRGIGKTTVNRLLEAAARGGRSVWKALAEAEQDPAHSTAGRKALLRFRGLIEMLRERAEQGEGPAGIARTVLDETGYVQALEDEDTAEADARLENLREVVGSMLEFERDAQEPTLTAFLELVTLQTDVDRVETGDAITLMTVHAAKGLEFPVVMVAGLEEEMFPHRGVAPDDDPDELEEERRLAYVAFTRAEQRLFLSYVHVRRVYGEIRYRRPSRFLDEMPQAELERVGEAGSTAAQRATGGTGGYGGYGSVGRGGAGRFPSRRGGGQTSLPLPGRSASTSAPKTPAVLPGDSYVDCSEVSDVDEVGLRRGMRVRHKKFGIGEVTTVGDGMPPRVTVIFPGWGEKTLVSSYLELA